MLGSERFLFCDMKKDSRSRMSFFFSKNNTQQGGRMEHNQVRRSKTSFIIGECVLERELLEIFFFFFFWFVSLAPSKYVSQGPFCTDTQRTWAKEMNGADPETGMKGDCVNFFFSHLFWRGLLQVCVSRSVENLFTNGIMCFFLLSLNTWRQRVKFFFFNILILCLSSSLRKAKSGLLKKSLGSDFVAEPNGASTLFCGTNGIHV